MSRLAALVCAVALAAAAPVLADQHATIPSQEDWVEARQSLTTADGLRMSYVHLREGEGLPLILLHGYTDNTRSWSLVAEHLGERPIYALDLRGHGGSDAPECCYDPLSLSYDVVAAMEALGISRADVAGHSLGSMTALALAATQPERVENLVLISTALSVPAPALDWLWSEVPTIARPIDPDGEFMLAWYWNPNPVDEDFLGRERAESAAVTRPVWVGVLQGLSQVDLTFLAARVRAPVLVLYGDQDGFFDAATQADVRAVMPGAEHVTFPGYGHNLHWEIPAETGGMVAEFLNR